MATAGRDLLGHGDFFKVVSTGGGLKVDPV